MKKTFRLVIADDLTGAMEVGLQSAPALIVNEVENFAELELNRNMVVNTQTRELSFSETQKIFQKTLSFISSSRIDYIKVDSTLRGEFSALIDVLQKEATFDFILVAPALPHNGRITKGGVHYLVSDGQEIPIHKTVYGNTLNTCRKTSSILDLIDVHNNSKKISLLPISTVQKGSDAIISFFNEIEASNTIVADAITDEDLDNIAYAIKKTELSILPVGSAGLFAALCRLPEFSESIHKKSELVLKSRTGKTLFLIGSLNPQNVKQVNYLLSSGKRVKMFELNSSELLASNEKCEAEICRTRKMIKKAIKQNFHPIIQSSRKDKGEQKTDSTIADSLVRTIDDEYILSNLGLILVTGGETALKFSQFFGVSGISVEAEIEPFVPIGRFIGGKVDNLPVVTKAGGFGSIELMEKVLTKL